MISLCLDRRNRDNDYKHGDGQRGVERDKRDDKRRHWDRDDKRESSRREDKDGKYSRDVDMKDRGSSRPQSGPPSAHPGGSSATLLCQFTFRLLWKTNKKVVQHLPSVLVLTQTRLIMCTRMGKLWKM